MARDRTLEGSLAAIRISAAAFLLVWSVDKILNTKGAQAVFANFYFWKDAPPNILMVIGVVQTLIILAFALGLLKAWTYGAVLAMHAFSTVASVGKMVPPYGPGASKLFWAAVPVLAALAALFALRNRDRLLSLGQPTSVRSVNEETRVRD